MRRIGAYNETNPNLKPLIDIANSLYFLGKVDSYRDFSRFIGRNSNYLNVLFNNPTKNPSVAVLLRLYKQLKTNKTFENIAENLRIHIGNRIEKQYL